MRAEGRDTAVAGEAELRAAEATGEMEVTLTAAVVVAAGRVAVAKMLLESERGLAVLALGLVLDLRVESVMGAVTVATMFEGGEWSEAAVAAELLSVDRD